jgi:hypothetical protein
VSVVIIVIFIGLAPLTVRAITVVVVMALTVVLDVMDVVVLSSR